MSKHEKLKAICDVIKYNPCNISNRIFFEINKYVKHAIDNYDEDGIVCTDCDVREIIFTPEFIEKLAGYLFDLFDEDMVKRDNAIHKIMLHLDDPVSYLYNLIIGN